MKGIQNFQHRKECICDPTATIYSTARVINSLQDPSAITIGPHSQIKGELQVFGPGGRISIGSYCYIGEDTRIWSAKGISIGNRVLISHNVNIFDNLIHPISPKLRHEHFSTILRTGQPRNITTLGEREIIIGDDVNIGAMAIVLRGVTIGEGSIVGAGSVVTKNIPSYSIAAGNPARIIRKISESER